MGERSAGHDASPRIFAGIPEPRQPRQPGAPRGRRIDGARRKAQLHLRACAHFAPHRQLPPNQCGAFRHPAQSVVSLDSLGGEHRLIDAFAVVPHPQSEFIAVVTDLDLDPPGLRVPEGIPQGFRRNLVDLVTKDRVQISRVSLDCDTECGRRVGARVGRELVAQGPDRRRRDHCVRPSTPASPAPRRGPR